MDSKHSSTSFRRPFFIEEHYDVDHEFTEIVVMLKKAGGIHIEKWGLIQSNSPPLCEHCKNSVDQEYIKKTRQKITTFQTIIHRERVLSIYSCVIHPRVSFPCNT